LIKSVINSLDREVIKLDRSISKIDKGLRPLVLELRKLHKALDRLASIKASQGVSRVSNSSKQGGLAGSVSGDGIFSAQQIDLFKNAFQNSSMFRFFGGFGNKSKTPSIVNGMPVTPPPIIPPPVGSFGPNIGPSTHISQWNKLRAGFHKDHMMDNINKGNNSGAVASLRQLLSSKMPAISGLMKLSSMIPVLTGLVMPIAAVGAGIVAFGVGLSAAVVNLSDFANQLSTFRKTSLNQVGPARAIAAQTGQNVGDVINRMNSEALPEILFAKLRTLYNIENDVAALQYAKANELEAYLNLRDLSKNQFDKMFENMDVVSPNTDQIRKELNSLKMEFEEIGLKVKDFALTMAYFAIAINPIIIMVRALNKLDNLKLRVLKEIFDFINNGKGKSVDKLDKAADKIDKAADKYLKAAGLYGGGAQFRKALQGVQFNPTDSDGTRIRNQIKALGDI
jgi:hypothetical protein